MAIVNDKIQDVYGLTPLQEGMLFHDLSDKESTAYVVQTVLKIEGSYDIKSFKDALDLLSARYDALRTMFVYEKLKEPKQIVLKEREVELNSIDLSKENSFEQKEKIDSIKVEDINRKFDLKNDSLLRVTVIKIEESKCVLIWTVHHIIMDGWCSNILFEKFFDYYTRLNNGESYDEMKKTIDEETSRSPLYSDYIKWLNKQDKEKASKYWKDELDDYENDAEIKPMKKPEPTEEQVRELWGELDVDITNKIKDFAESIEATINNVAETAVGILVQKYTRSEDVVFGKVVSGRNVPIDGIEEVVGMFINTIPVRITANKDMTVSELVKRQHIKGVESTNYDYCSLAEIQDNTVLKSNLIKHTYVFENYLSGVNTEQEDDKAAGNFSITVESSREQTHYGISFAAMEIDGKLNFKILYNPNQFCDDEIKHIMDKLLVICEKIALNPECKVSELEAISKEEKRLVLDEFNDTKYEYPIDKTVVELFEEQVERTPDNVAVVYEDSKITYRELNNRANALAHKLRELGVKPDDYVAVIAVRSIEMIEGIYGIIKSGGAYVPVDPTYPEDRIRFMLEDSNPKAVLVYTDEEVSVIDKDENVIRINDREIPVINLASSEVFVGVFENPERVNKPEDAVYCIYTSGTTGKPKGVPNINKGLINRVLWMHKKYHLSEEDAILQKTTFTFDVSVWEIIWWSLVGARVVMLKQGDEKVPDAIMKTIEKNKITHMHFVPSMLNIFLLDAEGKDVRGLSSLKYVFSSGEALSRDSLRTFNKLIRSKNENTRLINLYGPTESSIDVTYFDCEYDYECLPIGKPIDNVQIYIVQGDKLCGIGIPGELCIGGVGLARGYLNRPELTTEKFVKNPFGEGRMYHTGDLARWLPDGNIDYLGRIDEQVKIRGFRIELGEIESKIAEIDGVKEVTVVAKDDYEGEKNIYAYYVGEDSKVTASIIRDSLRVSLPEYMIPAYMMQIDSIPVTKNGKVDKRALPDIEVASEREYVAPRNEIEEMVSEIWCDVLNQDKLSVCDAFYELGGNSIRAMKLINRINQELSISIKLSEFLKSKMTIEDMSIMVEESLYNSLSDEEKEYLNE